MPKFNAEMHTQPKSENKLRQLPATAICGNDITSSCLYVSAITIAYAGQYAFVALLLVSGVLFMFRKIYGEVVGALPLNGGAYNVLLNTTSKSNASVAACLTILSYMATAVISASEAMHYLHGLVYGLPVLYATVGLLTLFLMLTIMGLSESAIVAVVIFIVHITAMLLLIASGGWFVFQNGFGELITNFQEPMHVSPLMALFLGFSAAMLGISGFESSANFVEEQAPGVFRKTLRNMWWAVTIINPLMALTAIAVLPLAETALHEEALLSHIGLKTGGQYFAWFISIDAVLVLSGAVLTSFVGVSGLIRRMALDRVLPQFLLKFNKRRSPFRILIMFFVLCLSVLFITRGELGPLAGVYTISFLLVMAYFGYGNLLLKIKRSRLPRPEYAAPSMVILAVAMICIALYGNVSLHPEYLVVFLQYFIPAIVIVALLLNRGQVLQYLLGAVGGFFLRIRKLALFSHLQIANKLKKLHSQEFVYFTKGDDLTIINKVMMYVIHNEITRKLKIVTVLKEGQSVSKEFLYDVDVLDRAYPEIEVEFVQLYDSFGPELIQRLSDEWKIPVNFMFIGSPSDRFSYRVQDLGGVRMII